jgi:hypothetical protein
VLSGTRWEYFWELAEHDGNMEQTPKAKKYEAPPPSFSKRPSAKKMTAFDWPVTMILHLTFIWSFSVPDFLKIIIKNKKTDIVQ